MYNFSAGPSALPKEVKEKIHNEWFDWKGLGASVVEVSHRSSHFIDVLEETKSNLKDLLKIPDQYKILFLHGGAQAQFAFVPMNFLGPKDTADYLLYGLWSNRAFDEAKMRGDIHGVPILEEEKPLHITNPSTWKLNEKAIYTHYCSNETISGVRLPFIPETKNALIADVSSDILSGPLDVSKFSLIYGCAQKNMGISGLAVVVLHKDMLEKVQPNIPTVFDFKKQTEFNSIYNTVNTFAIYVLNEVLKWNKEQGGLEEMQKRNHQKAQMLYDFIDASDFYSNNIAPDCRSIMNVTFYLPSEELDKQFDEASHKAGLCFLKGHRFHGGLRASIYNAMPLEGVQSLVDFMKSFEAAQP